MAELPKNIFAPLEAAAGTNQFTPAPPVDLGAKSQLLQGLSSLSDQKAQAVAQKTAAKNLVLNGQEPLAPFAAAQYGGNKLAQHPVYQDLRSLPYLEVVEKYGKEVADNRWRIQLAENHFDNEINLDRSLGEHVKDFAVGTAASAVNTAGSLAALGGGLINDKLGAAISEDVQGATDWIRQGLSDPAQRDAASHALLTELDAQENQEQYDSDQSVMASDNQRRFAGVNRALRGAADVAENFALNPSAAEAFGADMLGSLAVSGNFGKAAGTLTKGTRLAGAAPAAAIGLSEASGSYSQVSQEIMNMSEQELFAKSSAYTQLRSKGVSDRDARIQLANNRGLLATAINLPTAIVGGKLVEKFELAPLKASSLTEGLQNIGKEAVEETLQGVSGELASNMAIKAGIDADRNISDNVGESAMMGFLGGAGTAGALQAPRAATHAATGAVKQATKAVSGVLDRQEERRDAQSSVGSKASAEAATQITDTLSALPAAQETPVAAPEASETTVASKVSDTAETAAPVALTPEEKIQRARSTALMPVEEYREAPESVRRMVVLGDGVTGEVGRANVLVALSNEIQNKENTSEDREDAALWLYDQAERFRALRDEDFSDLPEGIQNSVNTTLDAINTILSNPKVKAAIEAAQEASMSENLPEITEESASSPEVTQAINKAVRLAEANPTGVDPDFAELVLHQRSKGVIQMDAAKARRLEAAARLARITRGVEAQKAALENTYGQGERAGKSISTVRGDIFNYGLNKKKSQLSLGQFMSGIQTAISKGNVKEAQRLMDNLGNFAEHMQSKVKAANASARMNKATNNKVAFRSWNGNNWVSKNADHPASIGINPNSAESTFFGKEVALDASAVLDTYNALKEIYDGTLTARNVSQIEPVDVIRPDAARVAEILPEDSTTTKEESSTNVQESKPAEKAEKAETGAGEPARAESKETAVKEDGTDTAEATEQESPEVAFMNGLKLKGTTFAAMAQESQDRVRKAGKAIAEKLGLDLSDVVESIVERVDEGKPRVSGYMHGARKILSLSRTALDNLGSKLGQHVLAHELGHALDFLNGDGKTFASALNDKFSSKKKGELYNEIIEAVKADPKWKSYFAYALGHRNDAEKASELFAEVAAVYALNPETAEEVFPKSSAYIEGLINGTSTETEAVSDEQGSQETSGSTDTGTESGSDGSGDASRDAGVSSGTDSDLSFGQNLPVDEAIGESRVKRAYVFDLAKSLLMASGKPLEKAQNLLKNFRKQSEVELDYNVSDATLKAYRDLVQQEVPKIIASVNNRLTKSAKEFRGGKFTPLQALNGEIPGLENVLHRPAGRVLNFVDPATGKYDETLLEAASLAAINWILNASSPKSLDKEDAAKLLGIDIAEVTPTALYAVNAGIPEMRAAEGLAREILQFWGATKKTNVPLTDSDGLVQSLAAQIIESMDDRFLRLGKFSAGDKEHRSIFIGHDSTKELVEGTKAARSLLKDSFLPEAERQFYFDEVPDSIRGKQKRNILGGVGAKTRKALANHQKIGNKRNPHYINMLSALGKDLVLPLLGYQEIDEKLLNKNDMASIEGKNISLERAWEKVEEHDMQLRAFAEKNGRDPNEVVTFFQYYVGSNGRIMAEGFTGQADKHMREAFTPTVAVLDMTTDKAQEQFWLTVAQSSDLVKTEIQFKEAGIAKVQEKIFALYPKSLAHLQNWVETGAELTAEQKEEIREEILNAGEDITHKLFHSLLSVARYEAAKKEGGSALSEFEHFLSLEADGKTDGPFNAMIHYLSGKFKPLDLRNLARGGLFFNERGTTLNQYYKGGDETKDGDLYEAGAEKLFDLLADKLKGVTGTPAETQMRSLLRFMHHFGDIEYSQDADGNTELVIGRKVLKNPLTVTVYGSGLAGIADKIAGGLVDTVYARMSEALKARAENNNPKIGLLDLPDLQNYPELREDFERLFTSKTILTKKGKWITIDTADRNTPPVRIRGMEDYSTFTFSQDNLNMFQANVKSFFAEPMNEAITSLLGNTKDVTESMQTATQMMSAVMRHKFQEAVNKTLEKRLADGDLQPGEFLSEDDYNAIYKEMAKFGAVIETLDDDDGHINLSNRKQSASGRSLFRSFSALFTGNSSLNAPSLAGVGVSPLLTISRGDAQMMVNYYASANPNLRTIQVYDGLEMPADAIEEISEKINQAAAEAWLDNPVKDVADNFLSFLRTGEKGPLEGLTTTAAYADVFGVTATRNNVEYAAIVAESDIAAAEDFAKAGKRYPEDGKSKKLTAEERRAFQAAVDAYAVPRLRALAQEQMEAISEVLNTLALSIQARKNVLDQVLYSGDHMASGESPYVHEGIEIEGDLIEGLNELYEKELTKLEKAQKKAEKAPKIIGSRKVLKDAAKTFGEPLHEGKVHRLSPEMVTTMMQHEKVPENLQSLFNSVASRLEGYSFVFGSREDLNAYRKEAFPDRADADPVDLGQTDPFHKTIFISNGSPETIAHEAVHAATIVASYAFYSDQAGLSEDQIKAFSNLEKLMLDTLDMNLTHVDPKTAAVVDMMRKEVRARLAEGTPAGQAAALNEFMAWTLANQRIADLLKGTKVRTPLQKIVWKGMHLIMRLLGIKPGARDILSNVRLNTEIALRSDLTGVKGLGDGSVYLPVLHQRGLKDRDQQRIANLRRNFNQNITVNLRKQGAIKGSKKLKAAREAMRNSVNRMSAGGFNLNQQERSTYQAIHAAFMTGIELDPKAMVKVQRMYSHVLKQIKPKDLQDFPKNNDDASVMQGINRYRTLFGKEGIEKLDGRNDLMASFLALSQTSPLLRRVLSEIDPPKDRDVSYETADEFVDSIGNGLMNSLSSVLSKTGLKEQSSQETFDTLAQVLSEVVDQDLTWAEQTYADQMGRATGYVTGLMRKGADKLADYADQRNENDSQLRQAPHSFARGIAALMSDKHGEAVAQATRSLLNSSTLVPKAAFDVLNEIMGADDETWGVHQLLNPVKKVVSALRQEYRERVPEILADKFSRKLTADEWTQMHRIARIDFAALTQRFDVPAILEMFRDPKKLDELIADVSEELSTTVSDRKHEQFYLKKAHELAKFMAGKGIDQGNNALLKNAYAIAKRFGDTSFNPAEPSESLVEAIDLLSTLYAVRELDAHTMEVMKELATNENDGLEFTTNYLAKTRQLEQAKHTTEAARINHYKGYVPSEVKEGAQLIVADDARTAELIAQGFTRLGTYKGTTAEDGRKAYFYSTVAGRNTYTQGIMQTVRKSASGVDPRTGFTIDGTTAGTIKGVDLGKFKSRLAHTPAQRQGEPVMPIFNEDGEIVAYERTVSPEQSSALGRNTHLGEMLGAWSGRQAEEELADGFNQKLIDELKARWDADKKQGRGDEYINLLDPMLEDPIHIGAAKMIPPELRDYIQDVFGDDGFKVRKDLIDISVGYRDPSVADAWTGDSRINAEVRRYFTKTMEFFLGDKAYKTLVTAEKAWQAGIFVAKDTIVVRSFVVPVSNIASNFVQLMINGVSPRDIYRFMTTGLVEIDQHLKHEARRIEIKAEMAATTSKSKLEALEAERQSLDDADRRMKIWPLIQAGEFSTISEGLVEQNAALGEGKLADQIANFMDRVPQKLGTVGRYAAVTRDTALFQGMSRMVQYGDFLAKAALYEHHVKRNGYSKEKALRLIYEEFVNYNIPAGRTRGYLESMGLTWFWAYKIRSVKVALNHVRNNPLRALLGTLATPVVPDLPGVDVGSPLTDNAAMVLLEDRAKYSVGLDMFFNAPSLNPWLNAWDSLAH